MRRRTFLTLGTEGIKASEAMACDICLCNKRTQKLLIVEASKFKSSEYPSSKYSPVGVVVVPGNHNVYGDGSCAIISLKPMNCNTPSNGGESEQSIFWGVRDIKITDSPNYTKVPYVGTSSAGDSTSVIVGEYTSGYLPSDINSSIQCPHDTDTYYIDISNTTIRKIPSPYLTNENRNPAYYQTSSPSSTNNALSDFNGKLNTNKIIEKRGVKDYTSWIPSSSESLDYSAASCCDMYYTEGTKQGDWYLPACGELGYIIPKFKQLQEKITILNTTYGIGIQLNDSYWYWTSTEYSAYGARTVSANQGRVNYQNKSSNYNQGDLFYVRAFLRVK